METTLLQGPEDWVFASKTADPRTTKHPAPHLRPAALRAGIGKDRLAYVSTLVLDHAARRGHRHQGAARIAAALDDSEHPENTYTASKFPSRA